MISEISKISEIQDIINNKDEIQDIINNKDNEQLLGTGGSSSVYLYCRNKKCIVDKQISYKKDNSFKEDALTEISILKKLLININKYEKTCKYLTCYYGYWHDTENKLYHIFSDYFEGDLNHNNWKILNNYLFNAELWNKIKNEEIIKDLCLKFWKGLQKIHAIGILHLDIKPQNLLVNIDSNNEINIKYIDFGLSCEYDTKNKTCISTKYGDIGTLGYMPTQVQLRNYYLYNKYKDFFSLGLVFMQIFDKYNNNNNNIFNFYNYNNFINLKNKVNKIKTLYNESDLYDCCISSPIEKNVIAFLKSSNVDFFYNSIKEMLLLYFSNNKYIRFFFDLKNDVESVYVHDTEKNLFYEAFMISEFVYDSKNYVIVYLNNRPIPSANEILVSDRNLFIVDKNTIFKTVIYSDFNNLINLIQNNNVLVIVHLSDETWKDSSNTENLKSNKKDSNKNKKIKDSIIWKNLPLEKIIFKDDDNNNNKWLIINNDNDAIIIDPNNNQYSSNNYDNININKFKLIKRYIEEPVGGKNKSKRNLVNKFKKKLQLKRIYTKKNSIKL